MAQSAANNIKALKLDGKVVIVTGGASGIGEATARLFAEQGARVVVIADIQDELGQQVAASIGANKCCYIHCHVTNEDQVKSLVESTVNTHGQLDIMVSNAGVVSRSEQTLVNFNLSDCGRLFKVNVLGMIACVKHGARAMVEKRVRGSTVWMASVAAITGTTQWTDYVMSQHSVLGLMRSASVQLAVHGIRVNSIAPTGMATPMTCHAMGMSPEQVQEVCSRYSRLQGAVITPKHVADAALFLASDDSEFVTGHNLVVDGGLIQP